MHLNGAAGHAPPIEQGATYDLTLTCYDTYIGVGDGGNVPRDLTGYTARMQIRQTRTSSGQPDLELLSTTASPLSRLVLGGAAGTIRIFITAAATAALTAFETGVYDLELERTSDGYVWREVEGNVAISRNVTR